MSKIKVAIIDDVEKIVDFFSTVIKNEPDMEVVGTANSGKEGVKVVLETNPDVVLIDINMETKLAGFEAIKKIKLVKDDIKFIILTIHEEDELLFQAYSMGVMNYIVKTSSVIDIIYSIRQAYKNELSLRPEVAEKILNEFSKMKKQQRELVQAMKLMSKLTTSELEVLKSIYKGNTYEEVAEERVVEVVTIKGQVNKILRKFNKKRMKDIVSMLEELKLFDIYNL